jgi:hypothetical protein
MRVSGERTVRSIAGGAAGSAMENHYGLGLACGTGLILLVDVFSFFVSRSLAEQPEMK